MRLGMRRSRRNPWRWAEHDLDAHLVEFFIPELDDLVESLLRDRGLRLLEHLILVLDDRLADGSLAPRISGYADR